MSTQLRVGDTVSVPGSMYGTLKFLGPVHGKKGTFAGVQLAPEFSARGKNSGDVEGRSYFKTTVPGSGIFLPSEKAEKRRSDGSHTPGAAVNALGGFNQGGRTPSAVLPKPNFSQSVGPGLGIRSASPAMALKGAGTRRESLPRPTSPLRKSNQTPAPTPVSHVAGRLATPRSRPSLALSKSTIGAPSALKDSSKNLGTKQLNPKAPSQFGQSLRASTRGSVTPNRMRTSGMPRSEANASTKTTEASPLGPEPAFDEEETLDMEGDEGADSTPTPAAGRSFRPVKSSAGSDEARKLKEQLVERDQQLSDQAASIKEMEGSLSELQQLMSASLPQAGPDNDEELPMEVKSLRSALREKNERIKALTAEFDANRADFRSTIDTLEMASTETERVYERRVEELLEEVRIYQEKNEDVESVAQQFKQLEELVQELEEGLEDARRGEAEARGEVEFLRGEVERGRSELRREKERGRAGDRLNGIEPDGSGITPEELEELHLRVDQKDDEIRGLKAIIQNLNDAAASRSPDRERTPRVNGGSFSFGHGHSKTKSTNTVVSLGQSGEDTAEHIQQQIRDLENLLDSKDYSDEQLREEVSKLRQSVHFGTNGAGKVHIPGLNIDQNTNSSNDIQKHRSAGGSSTASTARPGSFRSSHSTISAARDSKPSSFGHRRKDTGVPEFVDAAQSPIMEDVDDAQYVSNNTQKTDYLRPSTSNQTTPSLSSQTDASSNAALWCEICEESGHDILTCSNMGFGSESTPGSNLESQIRSAKPISATDGLRSMIGKDMVREGLRRSRESPHPPPDTQVPPHPTVKPQSQRQSQNADVDRPAPLSMSRSESATTSPTAGKSSYTISSPPVTTPVTSYPPTEGMLAGKESKIIDPNKWCALCEHDGHDSVDCPIEDNF